MVDGISWNCNQCMFKRGNGFLAGPLLSPASGRGQVGFAGSRGHASVPDRIRCFPLRFSFRSPRQEIGIMGGKNHHAGNLQEPVNGVD